ncbi:MAG: TonB-dependent receptor [Gammaproteobacteria bacterium]|nr:TonB-dependent receptor [Gammaproteobacteria bacterium]
MFRFVFTAAALIAATTAFAQNPPSTTTAPVATTAQHITQLSRLVVSAPTGTVRSLDDTLAPVVVIGRDMLEAFGSADIATVLRFHAGLDVAGNGGPGQPTSLFLRGTGSSQTLVLLDGIRINPGTIGGPPFNHILASGIQRVEIVAAPRSALYGTDAIGGVVSITLAQPTRNGLDWGAQVGAGHYSSRSAGAHAGGGNGTLFGGAAFHWFETAGFAPKLGSDQASAFRNQTLHGLAGAQNEMGDVYVTLWRSTGTTDYLDFFGQPTSQDYTDRVVSLHAAGQLAEIWDSRIILGQYFNGLDNPHTTDFTHTWRNSLDWRNDIDLGRHHLLTAGLFLAHQHVNALSFGTGYEDIERTRAVYLQDQMRYGPHRIVLAAREARFSSFGNKFVWNANYGFHFAHDWRVTAGLGTGFRAPTATDLYGFAGNPNLEPEYSHNQNVALYWNPNRHVRLGLNLYRNHVTDLIVFQASPSGGQVQNVGSATITGAHLSARLAWGPWRIEPAVNFQRPLNDETDGYLPRRSRRSATLNLGYDPGRWEIGLHVLATGPTEDSDFNDKINAGYVLTSLNAGFNLTRQWRISGRIENLFDIEYATAYGYRTAGRGLYVVLSYSM